MRSLRYGWTHIVRADDYELHMANIGQAQANAHLVRDLILAAGLSEGARVVFAGAGPGQMFEHADADYLRNFDVVFTDINAEFLARLETRAKASGLTRFQTMLDDVEDTKLTGCIEAAVYVLVLEHVDWKKCLESINALKPEILIFVVQRNPTDMSTMVAPHRELPGSLKEASECEKPCLIDQDELVRFMSGIGFSAVSLQEREVPDGKTMCGFVFKRGRD